MWTANFKILWKKQIEYKSSKMNWNKKPNIKSQRIKKKKKIALMPTLAEGDDRLQQK